MQNIKSNFYIVFSNVFQSSFPDGKFIPFQPHFFIKHLISDILCGSFFVSPWFNCYSLWKHLLSFLLIGFVVAFLFFIQSKEPIYDPLRLGFYFMTFIMQYFNIIEVKIAILLSEWKSLSITSSASSFIIIYGRN